MLSPPTDWRQKSEFVSNRQSGQRTVAARIAIECRCSAAISMDTHVGLNVATRVCDAYPDIFFNVLLTVHLSLILVINQPNTQIIVL